MTEDQQNAARQAAADNYVTDDNTLINDDAAVIEADGGVWVQAWLWVAA